MLKYDGTVDYFLNPNDYSEKEDGTPSDIANTEYEGNAMAQIPLCWVKRYTDGDYAYELVSNIQIDDDYKAYAHTREDNTVADNVYAGIYLSSGSASKTRSLSGQGYIKTLTGAQIASAATANGSNWYVYHWNLHQLLRTQVYLLSKSTDMMAFSSKLAAATGSGLTDSTAQFCLTAEAQKVFHMEFFNFPGTQMLAGLRLHNPNKELQVHLSPVSAVGTSGDGWAGFADWAPVGSTSNNWNWYADTVFCDEYGIRPKSGQGGIEGKYWCSQWVVDPHSAAEWKFAIIMGGGNTFNVGMTQDKFASEAAATNRIICIPN